MAIPALFGVIRLHGVPDVIGQFQSLVQELLAAIDRSDDFMEQLVSGADLPDNFGLPVPGYMTIRAGCPYTAAVGEMDRVTIFLIDILPHLMAGDTKRLRICQLQRPVKSAPKQYPAGKQRSGANTRPSHLKRATG